ncbi:MAG: hypothetical protein H0V91_03370 [Flavisolibacter sp.]|nr:hypothetical protein [Flavisolibacter sp.]
MKKMFIPVLLTAFITGCNEQGERTYTMQDSNTGDSVATDAPATLDTTASGHQDSTTNVIYDTSSRRKN